MANQNPQDSERSRGDNAKRFGKIGLLVGAVLGLAQGGGVIGLLQMGLLVGGVAAAGGAIAGNKLNPMFDKVMGMVPFFNKGQQKAQQQGNSPEVQVAQAPAQPQQQAAQAPMQAQAQHAPAVSPEDVRALDSIDPALLAGAREQTGQSMRSAGEGMEAGARPTPRPTHEAPMMRQ
jgi:hypothetical protein